MIPLAVTVLCFLFAGPAMAKDAGLTGLTGLKGTCSRLIVAGEDRSAECSGKLLNTHYADGRIGFYFILNDGSMVTFTIPGNRKVDLDAKTTAAPVDAVIVGANSRSQPNPAVGTCRYADPAGGAIPIICKAESAAGVFEASFQSDGSKPDQFAR